MRFSPYSWSPADLVGGDIAIDFINTAADWASGDPIDRLGGLEGLADWARVAGLVSPDELLAMKAQAARRPDEAARVFEDATALRGALWRLFEAAAHQRRAGAADLATLKDWTCRARGHQELAQTDDGFRDRWTKDAPILETPVYAIALAAEAVLKDGRLDRIHVCGGDSCEWMFLDNSKNASRRWCSMATCGNSAKVKKFRKRKNEAVSSGP